MESMAVIFGAFAAGLVASVIIRKVFKKEIPLYGNSHVPFLGISLNDRDKRLLKLALASFALCIVFLLFSFSGE